MKKLILIASIFLFGCAMFQPNIPWEERWANDYCNTTNWEELMIPPQDTSVLCSLAEKYQTTLKEAEGLVFMTALLISIPDPESTVPIIGDYVITLKTAVAESPTMTLADLFMKIAIDSENPRFHLIKNFLNIALMSQWGADPMAAWILSQKDTYFLNAHFEKVLYMIGYKPNV